MAYKESGKPGAPTVLKWWQLEKEQKIAIWSLSHIPTQMYECSISLQGGGGIEFSHSRRGTKLIVSGGQESSSAGLPLLPPSLIRCPLSLDPESPFELAGNVCRRKYSKLVIPPLDLSIQHKEWQEFWDLSGLLRHITYIITAIFHVLGPVIQSLRSQCYVCIPASPCS